MIKKLRRSLVQRISFGSPLLTFIFTQAFFIFSCTTFFSKEKSPEDDLKPLLHQKIPENLVSDLRQTLLQKSSKIFNSDSSDNLSELSTKELTIDLKNPNFTNGILTTHEGGVIKNSDIRIQAKTLQYIKRIEEGKPVHKIEAEGALMLVYKDRVFVGEELEYDFIEKQGIIYSGKTFVSPWYLSGEKIYLCKDGSYKIENVSITTCEHIDSMWDIFAGSVIVENRELLKANNVRLRLCKFPAFWIPSFKLNLKKFFAKPIFQYKFNWDKSTGPRGSIRYQAYSWRDFALFLRLDYRVKMGFGGAVETEYFPPHNRTTLITRSYLAQDMIPNDLSKRRRYRYQGAYNHISENGKTKAHLTWDKYSDIRMPNDFKSDDFEIDTAKKTEFLWSHQKRNLITIAHSRARANSFETIKQDIPTFYFNFRPIKSEKMGIVFTNWGKLSYLDYAYANNLCCLHDFHSFRFESRNEAFRPINLSRIIFTPRIGFEGIFYQNSPNSNPKTLITFLYGGKILTDYFRNYRQMRHLIEPYAEYRGLTNPTVSPDDHYIFSIKDGYNQLNMIKIGILNQFFSLNKLKGMPTFETDLHTNLILGKTKTKLFAYKGYLTLKWNLPALFVQSESGWNFSKKRVDFSNARVGWTVNENLAFAVEFRYRSQFDWRKADKDDFILDVTRPENGMLHSPLSDKRSTFLSHAFLRINPYWSLHFESHHGWNRKKEKGYNEFKIDLDTLLTTRWKIRLSYQHTEVDDRFTFDYYLMKF
jgi:hypothetical protein